MERFPQILDCIAVGQRRAEDTDEQVLLFVKMRNLNFTQALEDELRQAIKTSPSACHVPAYIFAVKDIPYTINMKRVENASGVTATEQEESNVVFWCSVLRQAHWGGISKRIKV